MKQKLEEAAEEYYERHKIHLAKDIFRPRVVDIFKSGAEWFKSLFPMMYFPPCIMPEDIMKNTESVGEETIVATTHDYIIFYKHRGYDIAYREYWKGHHNNKWKWKVKYGRYVDDDEILCWMRKEF